jgi:hypothetical protein
MQFYILMNGQRKGPLTLEQLATEGLERDTLVWHRGQPDWARADQVPALGELMLAIPPPVPRTPEALTPPAPPPPAQPPAPELRPEDFELAGTWVRYKPATFRTLYFWYVLLLGLSFALAVTGVVLLILAGNERYSRHERFLVNAQFNQWAERWVDDDAARSRARTKTVFGVVSLILADLALIATVVLFCVLLYKAWNQIQDSYARTSASKAVGFLFIPFFNLYWLFVAVYGLACDLHNYVVRRRLYGRYDLTPYPVSPGLSLACFILLVCNWVPFLNAVTLLPSLIVLVIWLNALKTTAAGIAAARLAEPTWAPAPVVVAASPPAPPPPPDGKSEHVRRFNGETPAPRVEEVG